MNFCSALPATVAGSGEPAGMVPSLQVFTDALVDVLVHVDEGHPMEVCGVLLGRWDETGAATTTRRLLNVQDRCHRLDPARFPRTARTGYRFDDIEHLRLLKRAKAEGLAVRAFYHSHVDASACFSAEDTAEALMDGEPRFPGVDYLVVGTQGGRAFEAFLYRFADGHFAGTPVPLPATWSRR